MRKIKHNQTCIAKPKSYARFCEPTQKPKGQSKDNSKIANVYPELPLDSTSLCRSSPLRLSSSSSLFTFKIKLQSYTRYLQFEIKLQHLK